MSEKLSAILAGMTTEELMELHEHTPLLVAGWLRDTEFKVWDRCGGTRKVSRQELYDLELGDVVTASNVNFVAWAPKGHFADYLIEVLEVTGTGKGRAHIFQFMRSQGFVKASLIEDAVKGQMGLEEWE